MILEKQIQEMENKLCEINFQVQLHLRGICIIRIYSMKAQGEEKGLLERLKIVQRECSVSQERLCKKKEALSNLKKNVEAEKGSSRELEKEHDKLHRSNKTL